MRRWTGAGRGWVYSRVMGKPQEGPELRLCSETRLQGIRAETGDQLGDYQ